jgi:hypothetical protein
MVRADDSREDQYLGLLDHASGSLEVTYFVTIAISG